MLLITYILLLYNYILRLKLVLIYNNTMQISYKVDLFIFIYSPAKKSFIYIYTNIKMYEN